VNEEEHFPRARARRLLIEELEGETLVYDLENHRAHCLNEAAALVWKRSDGTASVETLADMLPEVGLPRSTDVVRLALARLSDADLLDDGASTQPRRISRREVLRVLGATAAMTLLLPAVDSVVAPLAAQAASCLTAAQCRALKPPNCSGLPICNRRRRCCVEVRRRRRRRCLPRAC